MSMFSVPSRSLTPQSPTFHNNHPTPLLYFKGADPYDIMARMSDQQAEDIFMRGPMGTVVRAMEERYPSNKSFAFAGDNFGPVDPKFFLMSYAALHNPHRTYQREAPMLDHAQEVFQKTFANGPDEPVVFFMTPTGTAGNRLGFSPVAKGFQSIIFAGNSHGLTREAGAFHALNGVTGIGLPTVNGKLQVETVEAYLKGIDPTYPNVEKPMAISISQPSEDGTLYSDQEVRALAKLAHDNGLLLQMDGARLFYAVAGSRKNLKALTTDLGVDIVFLGGSKGGMFAAEAMVYTPNFFKNAKNYRYEGADVDVLRELRSYAKQYGLNMGQAVGALSQFIFALKEGHAEKLAQKAVHQALNLEETLTSLPGISIYTPTQTNAVMVTMPKEQATALEGKYHLMVFKNRPMPPGKEDHVVVRLMTTANTTDEQIHQLRRDVQEIIGQPEYAYVS